MTKDTMIGVDLAKNVFVLHAASMSGLVKFRKKLTRQQFARFMAAQPPAVVVMEACGGAHYWSREMSRLGHEVKLIAPQYVKPFCKFRGMSPPDSEMMSPPRSESYLKRLEDVVAAENSDLPDMVREEYLELLEQIADQTRRIDGKTKKMKGLAATADITRRLQTMPGAGPLIAGSLIALAGAMIAMMQKDRPAVSEADTATDRRHL